MQRRLLAMGPVLLLLYTAQLCSDANALSRIGSSYTTCRYSCLTGITLLSACVLKRASKSALHSCVHTSMQLCLPSRFSHFLVQEALCYACTPCYSSLSITLWHVPPLGLCRALNVCSMCCSHRAHTVCLSHACGLSLQMYNSLISNRHMLHPSSHPLLLSLQHWPASM